MSALSKKMLRSILRNRGQAIAVAMVVLCGTACYICLSSLHRNLLLTRDTYYSQNRFADFEIMLERAPTTTLFKIEDIPGVRQARCRIVKDVNVDIEGVEAPRTGRIISMPDRRVPVINDIVIIEGRYFEEGAQNEVIMGDHFAKANNLSLGDSIKITVDGKKHTLRIVGRGLSPEYVYVIRNIQELVPSPERFGILWVPEDFAETALNMEAACNNIVGMVDHPDQLDSILDAADKLLDSYGVFAKVKQKDQLSNRFISDEIKGLAVSARILPTVFLGIASLVIFILLNRMVRNERTQIGLMKAYGYSSLSVGFHYVQFGLILSIVGCLGGFVVGQWLAGQMIKIYVQFYQFPVLQSRMYPDVIARAAAIAIFFGVLGALLAALRAARMNPAESMRPPSPRTGRRVLLERIGILWVRLSFTWKMIARNVSRNKFRSGLNVLGVMISSGLIIVGFFALDGMEYMLDFQFNKTQREDVKVTFAVERSKAALYEASRFEHVLSAEPILQYPFEVKNGWHEKDIFVFGLPRGAHLQKLIGPNEREIDVGTDGLILAQWLANDLGVRVGDTVLMKPLMGRITKEKTVRISKVVKQYFGASGYMNIEALSRVLDEPFAMNAALLRTEKGKEEEVSQFLKDLPAVASIEVKKQVWAALENTIGQSMWIMSVVTILFAAIIAFSIIYNVTTVSLAERQRELASLRVLGFEKGEVGRILYYENFVTGVMGLILGTPFGLWVCSILVNAYENELYRMPFHIQARTFWIANVATVCFIVMANLAVRRKINDLDLVEVLKARE